MKKVKLGGKKFIKRDIALAKQIDPFEGLNALEFCEKYFEIYNDKYLSKRYESVVGKGFMSLSFFEALNKRIPCFSEDELESPDSYVIRYGSLLDKILYSFKVIDHPKPYQARQLNMLRDLFDFFKKFGYWTEKQIKLLHKLNLDLDLSGPETHYNKETELILNSHLVKPYFSNSSAIFNEEPITDKRTNIEIKPEKPKKMALSLSEMRRVLESD